ncbi:hypothetical protein RFI_34852 [Reticulomyxa filosa]|uniref:Kinesin motor domain-containing protein n=1 Tax=Reticulomyxa filosa TaxID=46433 RepID=X6LMG2_RETFI|nr:hypothetical protein RFI_34852 [Reticulomyxa filosa]|eukprot:ETO02566.1 hypothetical protein RFI_34852 [Reticulomyxa filosa]
MSISIYARIRKPNQNEKGKSCIIVDKDTITTVGPPSKSYSFHSVFREHASNELCNTIIDQMLHNVIMGFNAVLFAYGQTVSGKTFSIIGNQQQTETGMLPHMLRSALDKQGISRVSISAVEVFGQIVTRIEFFDLLDQSNQNSDWSKKIGSTTINIDKLNQTVIQNPEDAYTIVQTARQASHVAPTGKNPDFSRGHVVFLQLQVMFKELIEQGKLTPAKGDGLSKSDSSSTNKQDKVLTVGEHCLKFICKAIIENAQLENMSVVFGCNALIFKDSESEHMKKDSQNHITLVKNKLKYLQVFLLLLIFFLY